MSLILLSSFTNNNKIIFLLVSVVIVALIIDTSFIKIYPFIFSQSISSWRIVIFLAIGTIYAVGQYLILNFVKKKSKKIISKEQYRLNAIHKIVTIVQYALTAVFVFVILQMVITSRYNIVMLIAAIWTSYTLAILMTGLLAQRFFSWFMSNRNYVVFFYGLSSGMLAINAVFTVAFVSFVLLGLPVYIRPHLGEAMVPFIAPNSVASILNLAFVISSILSFILSWSATALLLRHYSYRLGRIRYWIIVSTPLAFFLAQFQSPIYLDILASLLPLDPISFSTLYTLIFTLSKSAGGILFGIAFWTVAISVRQNRIVKDYMIISSCGLALLFVSNQAIVLINGNYPPFGLAASSFMGISSYLLLVGIYSAAISVAQDIKLRQSIRESAEKESKLLGSIGFAHMEQEIHRRVIRMSKEYKDRLTEETGLESSLDEDEMKEYLKIVLNEISNKKEYTRES
jgi:hypothetical protein